MKDGERDSREGACCKNKNETHERIVFSARFACPVSGFTIDEIEPRLFSFNAPAGACPTCDGLGTEMQFEADLVVPDRGAVAGQGRRLSLVAHRRHLALLRADAVGAGQALQGVDGDAVGASCPSTCSWRSSTAPATRTSSSPTRTACALQNVQALRGRDRQHRAALERDRQRVGARGAVALPGLRTRARRAAAIA